jgi:hypothetical protein
MCRSVEAEAPTADTWRAILVIPVTGEFVVSMMQVVRGYI